MKRLLFVILPCFCFVAPLQSNAGVAGGKKLTKSLEKGASQKGLIDYLVTDECDAAVNFSNHRNSTTQNRTSPFSGFLPTIGFPDRADFSSEKKFFLRPPVYFKPIALKLVFPEHYFW